jgi:iron complex outermembrane receptor protein
LESFYQPEHVWSYEVGEKAQLFDNHLQLNLSAYHEKLVNMQVFIQSGASSVLQNAAGAHVNGLEAQATWIPIDNLRINLAGAVTSGKYDQYLTDDNRFAAGPGPGCGPAPKGCNFAGNYLNQTPPYTLDLGVEYDWLTSIGTITPRIDTFWSGKVYFIPDNLTDQHSYNETDLNLMWTDPSNRYTLEAFVKNVGNTAIISNDGLQSGSLSGLVGIEPDNYTYYAPRTFGIRFGVKFD